MCREIQRFGQLHGYKWMHTKCLENGYVIDQETVRNILKCIDPEGVRCRTKRRLRRREYSNPGPNYLWHLDGYDKLKPYGICIHGCIDGYSREIIWLEAASSNNNPRLIAGYFVDAVSKIGGCPKIVRADMGTEMELFVNYKYFFVKMMSHVTQTASSCMGRADVTRELRAGGEF